ncbi:immunoglobulin domain-containing protein [Luteolibacter flavescens]|uniref:Immunoglobulin domain-containing protein n=1 Tax=Luteolibacter flavescens TaxID=1859460 RepID=A0ABT3FWE2_9BACT|nr:immunoglobulin domain-containing protein [Luteolibacter flavescens]MCW1887639.1 immunoglobulin domain-containing protein [Luteolibacter flavescens]
MKRPYPNSFRNCTFVLTGCLSPLALQAAPLAYEGFDYATGTGNLTTLNGGTGWNGAWQTVNNGSADILTGSMTAGASSPAGYDALSIGNSSLLPNNRRVGRLIDTSANGPFGLRGYRDANGRIGADGTTIYLSFLQQANGTSSYYEFEFHRDNLGDSGRIGGIGNDQGGNNVHLRAPNGTHTLVGPGNTNVNFYVVRIDFKAGNDDVYVYQNPTSATEPTPTLTKLAAADMSFNGISFGAFNNSRTISHDEVRIGQTWGDVTIPVASAPTFASQPQASVTAFTGGTVTLTAAANGHPAPTYQWYRGATLLTGQTGTSLTLNNVQAGDAGAYHAVATNSQGTATSSNATVVVQTTPATLLAYEGFDYSVGVANMNGKNGGVGWGAPWTAVDGGGGNPQTGNLVAGTNAPNGYDAQSLSNSSFIPNAKRDGRVLDTTPGGRFGTAGYIDGNGNIGADGKTLYLSFLQQPDGTSLFYEFEFHRGNLGDPGRIAGIGNDTAGAVVNLRTPQNSPTLIGPGSTGVNFYVVRIDYKAGNQDEIRIYQNPVSATEPGVPTVLKTNGGDLSFNGLSMAAFVNGRTVKHDEIRIGQNWSDVVSGTSRRNLTWVGNGTTNPWDFSSTVWNDGVGATAFADGDPVTFANAGSGTPALNVTTNVSTASILVDNSTHAYSFGGTGTITSSGGLHKLGTSALTITAPTVFGSSVLLDAGDVALNGTSTVAGNLTLAAGSGALTLGGNNTFNGSMLDAGATARTFSGTNSFTGLATTNASLTFSGTTNFTGAGAVIWFGNLAGSNTSVTIEPGAVINVTGNYNDSTVFGRDGGSATIVQNGGTFTFNPANRGEMFLGASLNTAGTTVTYEMKGGTLDLTNKRLAIALGGNGMGTTGVFTQTAGTVLARQLDLGANVAFGNATYTLEGGSLTIGAGGITTATGSPDFYALELGGGTVGAADNWSSSLDVDLTGTNGNTTFDTSTHTVRLSGIIDGAGGIVKNGTGTLVLNGFNGYNGPTQVTAGTVGGRGAGSNSALTVASGATVSPGDVFADSFAAASAVLSSGSTLHVMIDNETDSGGQLQVGGTANITGANLTFSEIGTGFVPSGTDIVIVDASGGRTGTFAGLAEGATVDTGVNTFTIHYTPTQVKLTSTSAGNPYSTWAAANGLDGSTPQKDPAFEADPDGDGIANGLEWVLGGNPQVSGASLVTATGSGANGLTIAFNREETSIGFATLLVQWNTDLGAVWTDVPIEATGGTYANGVTVTVDDAATPDRVTVTIPAANSAGGKLFGRIHVTAVE